MKIALISVTENGRILSERIADCADEKLQFTRFALKKYSDENSMSFESLKEFTAGIFQSYDALIFITACGIAVRMIAPNIQSKITDPAVLAIDERGKFVVSLLSGHIGGANALAEKIADVIGGMAVITTATDVCGKFSPDSFARANDLHIVEMSAAKAIAARIVNGKKIGIYSEYKYVNEPNDIFDGQCSEFGIYIGDDITKGPFEKTLHLVPKNIVIGVGCKKNIGKKVFFDFVLDKLGEFRIPIFRVSEIHSIDLKKNESAILEFGEKYDIPVKFYTTDELMKLRGDFSVSEFVLKATGSDNVCERSALIDGGKLLVKKQSYNGVTFAAAAKNVIIDFKRNIL